MDSWCNPGPAARLPRRFFDRATEQVARELLGAELTVRRAGATRTVRLVETEAYVGDDPANHAFGGPSRRNLAMFGPPGTLYVYRIHQVVCANLVTRPGEAVLLRAAAPVAPEELDARGPGRLCRALGISIRDNGADVTVGAGIELRGFRGPRGRVAVGPRVGLRRAVERPLRFALAGEPAVSRPRPPAWADRLSAASPRRTRGAGPTRRSRTRRRRPSAGGRHAARSVGR